MIATGPDLRAAVERAARDNPGGDHLFELGEGLGPVVLKNLPFTGRVEFRGGSIAGMAIRSCGDMVFNGVRFFGQQQAETWGGRVFQLRFGADASLMVYKCRFEATGEPWTRPDGLLVDGARRVRVQECEFHKLFNGASTASVGVVEYLSNDFRQTLADAISVRNIIPAATPRVAFTAHDNLFMDAAEVTPRHPDAMQLTYGVPITVNIARNVMWSPGRSFQGVLTQTDRGVDAPITGRIVQNHMLTRLANAIYAWRPGGLFVAGNVLATECSRDPGASSARIHAQVPGMTAQGNHTFRLSGPIHDAGGNVLMPRGAYEGRLRGPWRAGEWGDVLASPPSLDAPARAVKRALRVALSPM
jgi:hypothetical protein